MNRSMLAALFDDGRTAKNAAEQLVTGGHPLELTSFLMSDRTAEREFSVSRRTGSELEVPLQGVTLRLAAGLRPLAALGTPGSGTVGNGPVISLLQRAGVGVSLSLDRALGKCGIETALAGSIVREVKNGGVVLLASVSSEPSRALFSRATEDAKSRFELHGDDASTWPSGGIVAAPSTPAGEQRAAYQPLRQPNDDEIARHRPRF